MLKNIYFTDFDSKDEVIVKELLHLDNTPDRSRTAGIRKVNMGYYFKKDDIIEIDCKLILHHNTYEYANSIVMLYDLYDGTKQDQNKLLFRETRRYNEFPLIKDRIIAYSKLCHKVKYNGNNITLLVYINALHKKMHLLLYNYIIQNGVNYLSVKHYGKF